MAFNRRPDRVSRRDVSGAERNECGARLIEQTTGPDSDLPSRASTKSGLIMIGNWRSKTRPASWARERYGRGGRRWKEIHSENGRRFLPTDAAWPKSGRGDRIATCRAPFDKAAEGSKRPQFVWISGQSEFVPRLPGVAPHQPAGLEVLPCIGVGRCSCRSDAPISTPAPLFRKSARSSSARGRGFQDLRKGRHSGELKRTKCRSIEHRAPPRDAGQGHGRPAAIMFQRVTRGIVRLWSAPGERDAFMACARNGRLLANNDQRFTDGGPAANSRGTSGGDGRRTLPAAHRWPRGGGRVLPNTCPRPEVAAMRSRRHLGGLKRPYTGDGNGRARTCCRAGQSAPVPAVRAITEQYGDRYVGRGRHRCWNEHADGGVLRVGRRTLGRGIAV